MAGKVGVAAGGGGCVNAAAVAGNADSVGGAGGSKGGVALGPQAARRTDASIASSTLADGSGVEIGSWRGAIHARREHLSWLDRPGGRAAL
jgi:hypothetical protein